MICSCWHRESSSVLPWPPRTSACSGPVMPRGSDLAAGHALRPGRPRRCRGRSAAREAGARLRPAQGCVVMSGSAGTAVAVLAAVAAASTFGVVPVRLLPRLARRPIRPSPSTQARKSHHTKTFPGTFQGLVGRTQPVIRLASPPPGCDGHEDGADSGETRVSASARPADAAGWQAGREVMAIARRGDVPATRLARCEPAPERPGAHVPPRRRARPDRQPTTADWAIPGHCKPP